MSFLRQHFPHYNEKMVTVPGDGFQYKLPGNQHGIPSKAKEIRLKKGEEEMKNCKHKATPSYAAYMSGGKQKKKVEKSESDLVHTWEKLASGQFAEQRVYDMLVKRFSKEPCLLVHEFKESDLVKVIKENIDMEKKENKNNDLIQQEFKFFKLTNRHFFELEKQSNKMMETIIEERLFQDRKADILKKIREHKPGFGLLTESNQNNYLKNFESFLEKKFRDGAQFTKSKFKDIILEHLLYLTYPNSEYDLLLFLKVCAMSKSFILFTLIYAEQLNNSPI